ncbi:MAG: hypothetical protein CL878_03490 [Dehalococcoidia bacterium]|nr:hypothetical protein [Dehalococcoidia bacterium]
MATLIRSAAEAVKEGQTLAAADQVLIDPKPGTLPARVEELLGTILATEVPADQTCRTLIRLGMNFAGRDAQIVGYGADEIKAALDRVLSAIDQLDPGRQLAMGRVVVEFLTDMHSVNAGDSLPGLLAERIEPQLNRDNPGRSFLSLLEDQLRSSIYWQMIGEGHCRFGNDYARGLEYLRHLGFCQVSTNPTLAAKAFDEDPGLTEELRAEVANHEAWLREPAAHADEIAMAATLIALWPNLSVFRPLAIRAELQDYVVSFQLNPNIAHLAEASIDDAHDASALARSYLRDYDRLLGLGPRAGEVGPNIVFKVAGGHEAGRAITEALNSEGIGTNNTVVYTVAQELQLILDAFAGKAVALRNGLQVTRAYETNMGGRFVSHLREVVAVDIFVAVASKAGDSLAAELLFRLAEALGVDPAPLDLAAPAIAERAEAICAFQYLKSLDHPQLIAAAAVTGLSAEAIRQLEEDIKKAGTLVARRVYGVFYAPANRSKWRDYLQRTQNVSESQADAILDSMDVLPASKRIPEDTFHTLGASNMCNTEFPNHARAVQVASEQHGFELSDYRDSILGRYGPDVAERLRDLPDFRRGYDLTPALKGLLMDDVGIDVADWETEGLEPAGWPDFGSVQKTTAEFRAAYDTFAARCVDIAMEVAA